MCIINFYLVTKTISKINLINRLDLKLITKIQLDKNSISINLELVSIKLFLRKIILVYSHYTIV